MSDGDVQQLALQRAVEQFFGAMGPAVQSGADVDCEIVVYLAALLAEDEEGAEETFRCAAVSI
jgi:hypothetical protein